MLIKFFLLLFLYFSLWTSLSFGGDTGIQMRILTPLINAIPDQVVTIKTEVINRSCSNKIYVSHLSLPYGWEAIPSNDILIHMDPGQCSIQTLMIRPSITANPGEYQFTHEVWARDNPSIMDFDKGTVIIGEQNINTPLSLEITSPPICEINLGDVIYLSAIVNNLAAASYQGEFTICYPKEWQCTPSGPIPLDLAQGESKLLIFGIKVGLSSLAGEHQITLSLNLEGYPSIQRTMIAIVRPKIEIVGRVEGCLEAYNLNQMTPFYLRYSNHSNIPLKVVIDIQTEPKCNLEYTSEPFEIPPFESIDMPIILLPESSTLDFSQFLLVRLLDAKTGEQLYQNPMTLKFMTSTTPNNDPYVYIPAYAKGLVLGDRYKGILATEFAGGGVIDSEKNRTLDFFFRLPTDVHHVIYNIDQRLYAGIQDDEWKFDFGDTVYALSPLTQYYRYGRGANVEHAWDNLRAGIHYTQNTLRCDQDPHELCAYVEYYPTENSSIATNYLHKVEQDIPTSNMITLQSIIDWPSSITTEAEIGTNFISENKNKKNWAYRLETHGRMFKDTWFSIEKIYAGPRFYGYYNNIHLFSSSIDFPIKEKLRLNLTTNHLYQNFCLCDEEEDPIIPKQYQYSANLSYCFNRQCSFGLNGLLLRGRDLGKTQQYNFYQKWIGFSVSLATCGCNLNAIISYGLQNDYLSHKCTYNLQRYYAYLSKDFSSVLNGSIFYDSGNLNYYDAKPWRIGYGGALAFRFAPTGFFNFFMQKIKHTCDSLDMTQFTVNCNYIFKNLHRLECMVQYYRYCSGFPNETIFLISYAIPMSLPVGYRKDVGHLEGYVYDSWNNQVVKDALVNCGKSQTSTNENGYFTFSCLPGGQQFPEISMLPDELIEENTVKPCVEIIGGKMSSVCLPVLPSCSIDGEVILYGYKDIFSVLSDPLHAEIIPLNGLEGICIAIANENEEEIYACTTNKKGAFRFPKLRPGRWHIKILSEQIPPLHELNMNHLILEVLPKENKWITFKISPTAPQVYKLE